MGSVIMVSGGHLVLGGEMICELKDGDEMGQREAARRGWGGVEVSTGEIAADWGWNASKLVSRRVCVNGCRVVIGGWVFSCLDTAGLLRELGKRN